MKWPYFILLTSLAFPKLYASEIDSILKELEAQNIVIGLLSESQMAQREALAEKALAKAQDETENKEVANPLGLDLVDTVSTAQSAGTDFIDLSELNQAGSELTSSSKKVEPERKKSTPSPFPQIEEEAGQIPVFYFD